MVRAGVAQSVVVMAAMVAAAGCSPDRTGPEREHQVAVPEAGVAIGRVPAGLRVVRREDGRVVLAPDRGEGEITFRMSSPVDGVLDPLGPARAVQEEIERLPDGAFLGSQELRTPLGKAFTARGRYRTARGVTEEIRVLAVHPRGDRFLTVTSVHPAADDSAARVQILLEVFTELGDLPESRP